MYTTAIEPMGKPLSALKIVFTSEDVVEHDIGICVGGAVAERRVQHDGICVTIIVGAPRSVACLGHHALHCIGARPHCVHSSFMSTGALGKRGSQLQVPGRVTRVVIAGTLRRGGGRRDKASSVPRPHRHRLDAGALLALATRVIPRLVPLPDAAQCLRARCRGFASAGSSQATGASQGVGSASKAKQERDVSRCARECVSVGNDGLGRHGPLGAFAPLRSHGGG